MELSNETFNNPFDYVKINDATLKQPATRDPKFKSIYTKKEDFKHYLGRRSYYTNEQIKQDDMKRGYDGEDEFFAKKGYNKT